MRPLAHAGRWSEGLGGNGRARQSAHAVGMRACGEWAIWSVASHWRGFEETKIQNLGLIVRGRLLWMITNAVWQKRAFITKY